MFEYSSRPGAPLRNRTVDLLLTMATPHRPGRTSCTNGTAERSGSTECTQCARHPVHDSFHDQLAASGSRITLSDGVQITLSDGAVIRFRAIDLPASDYLGRQASRRCATVSTVTTCFGSSTVYSDGTRPGHPHAFERRVEL